MNRRPWTYRVAAAAVWLMVGLLLDGCAGVPQTRSLDDAPPELVSSSELSDVPFFPQQRYQCGPAALATVLQAAAVEVAPDDLVSEVYIPERRGSLQPEMLAAARRHGRAPYVLAPELTAVLAELHAGNPVLVLQNLGWSWLPRWHYAVVVGFDRARAELVLRSGTTRRLRTPVELFERTWARAAYWAVTVTAPDRLPATAHELPWLRVALAFEQAGQPEAAARAWQAATIRWERSPGAWMGLGNLHFRKDDYPAAARAFRQLLEHHPDYSPALNNLAYTLYRQGRIDDAKQYAEQAVAVSPGNREYARTLAEIRASGSR